MEKFRRNSKAAWRRVDEEVLIVSTDRNSLTVLNDTGARVWELLESSSTEDELAAKLSDEYEVEAAAARRDVEKLLKDLIERGLVTSGE